MQAKRHLCVQPVQPHLCVRPSVCVPDTVDKEVDDVAGHVRRLRVESEEGAVILDQQRCAHLAAKDYV